MSELLWCLDLWYEAPPTGTEMHLFCIDDKGNRLEIVDDTVSPRFIAKGYVDPLTLSGVKGFAGHSYVKKLEAGYPSLCTEIFTKYPFDVSTNKYQRIGARYDLEALGFPTAAADIFFDDVYKLAKGILPCAWFEFNPETKDMEMVDRHSAPPPPKLRKLVFDIEVYNPAGAGRPDLDPVVSIGVKTDDFATMLLADDHDDRAVIQDFVDIFNKYDPDVPSHYFGNHSDFPYLKSRSAVLGVPFNLGRDHTRAVPFDSQRDTVSIKGRGNVDLHDYAVNYVRGKTSAAQNDVYEAIFGTRSEYPIDRSKIWELWDNDMREEVIRHCEADVDQTYDILNHALGFGVYLARMSSIPLDQVFTLTTARRIEQALMRYADARNEVIPNIPRAGAHKRYLGALTFPPLVGLHEDVYYLDFSGMYATAARNKNLSFDTLRPDGKILVQLEDGTSLRFADHGEHLGAFSDMMGEFLVIRAEMREIGVTDEDMDFAVKTLMAAATGYFGWNRARWYDRRVIRAIIKETREAEAISKNTTEELGWVFVYGDTDSTFVKDPTGTKDVDALIEAISDRTGFRIKIDDHFVRIGFGDAKKHYWGITDSGKLVIRGMESIRGEWCRASKVAQRRVIDLVLRDGDVRGAIAYSKGLIEKFKKYQFSLEDIIIRKGLQQEVYSQRTAHAVVAERMGMSVGTKVEYVITKAFGRKRTLADKAKAPVELRSLREIDVEYYIEKQIGPAVGRILDVVMYKKHRTLGEVR